MRPKVGLRPRPRMAGNPAAIQKTMPTGRPDIGAKLDIGSGRVTPDLLSRRQAAMSMRRGGGQKMKRGGF